MHTIEKNDVIYYEESCVVKVVIKEKNKLYVAAIKNDSEGYIFAEIINIDGMNILKTLDTHSDDEVISRLKAKIAAESID